MNNLLVTLEMTEQEKTIAKIFDKSVEALGIMTKSLCDAIKSTKTDLQTDRLYTADDMEAFAEFLIGRNTEWITELERNETAKTLIELWERERKDKESRDKVEFLRSANKPSEITHPYDLSRT